MREIQTEARTSRRQPVERRAWPMIVLRSPKGWTGPKRVDGQQIEGSWRSHQVPFSDARGDDDHRKVLEKWLRSYQPEKLFGPDGTPVADRKSTRLHSSH